MKVLELPGFNKCNKPIQNGRSRSARPKEERVAAKAKWEVVYEMKKILNLFISSSVQDPLEAKLEERR